MTADVFPAPKVPLDADGALDLDQLGSNDLTTHVWFPGIDTAKGGFIFPNWRGCTFDGDAGDNANNAWPIDETLVTEGLPIRFPNALLVGLDQGWVFYSYSVQKPGEPAAGPESKRLFFYVGKRQTLASQLPVPQVQQSHNLQLNPDRFAIPDMGITVSVPPYAAMKKSDVVTLQWRGFTDAGVARPLNPPREVKEEDVGKPLTWFIGRTEIMLLEDGRVELNYRIKYAGGGNETVSALQNLQVVAPTAPRLPEPTIDSHGGGPLDPENFLGGATLRIALHPGARVGDILTLYATVPTGTSIVEWVRLDPSTFDSDALTVHLKHAWLLENNGKSAELVYQFARPGTELAGEPLTLPLRTRLDLEQPIISDMHQDPGDEEYEGRIEAGEVTTGVRVRVPATGVGEADTISVFWGEPGHPDSSVIATPVAGDWRAFDIPKKAIAMNMGTGTGNRDRLKVFYRVTLDGDPPELFQDSKPFYLKVVPFPQSRFPTIFCIEAQGTGGVLSLASIKDPKGAEFRLERWAYIDEGQVLNIQVFEKDQFLLKDHRVTRAEADAPHITAWLLKSYIQSQVGVGKSFKVSVTVSFDEGRTKFGFRDSPEMRVTD